jgi:hypothetical protein
MSTLPKDFRGAARLLQPEDITREAALLQCTTAIIHAFSDIESAGGGFIPGDGRLKILHEARIFHLKTQGRFDESYPNLSSPVWDRSLYGAGGTHQWDRFLQAYTLDPDAALQSSSLGRYQVMGMNFAMLGYSSASEMWADYADSEDAHLRGFGSFIRSAGLLRALRSDPPGFVDLAVGYNGAGERANGYDQKLATAFYHYASAGEGAIPSPLAASASTEQPGAEPLPPVHAAGRVLRVGMTGDDVKRLQAALGTSADGVFGAQTEAAVEAFQDAHQLTVDGIAGPATKAALGV